MATSGTPANPWDRMATQKTGHATDWDKNHITKMETPDYVREKVTYGFKDLEHFKKLGTGKIGVQRVEPKSKDHVKGQYDTIHSKRAKN